MYKKEIKVNFFDTDPGGIIFYANIFRYIHTAYEEFLAHFNTQINFFDDNTYILPIIHTEADYISPIKLHENLQIEIIVTQLKKSSFELCYNISTQNEKLKCRAKTVHVCVDKKTFMKEELPEELHKSLSAHKG